MLYYYLRGSDKGGGMCFRPHAHVCSSVCLLSRHTARVWENSRWWGSGLCTPPPKKRCLYKTLAPLWHSWLRACITSSLTSSLISPIFFCLFLNYRKSEIIFAYQNLNWLTYPVHAKSTGELINFGFSDRSVRSLVSAKRSANRWVQTRKNDFTFWLIFGLSPNLGLSDGLSEKLIQKQWMTHWLHCDLLKLFRTANFNKVFL